MAMRDLLPGTRRGMPTRREEGRGPFTSLQREMNRMFDDFFSDFRLTPFEEGFGRFYPTVDVKETDKEIQVSAELPGMSEKDLDITVADDVLSLRGEKKEEKEDKEGNYYSVERSYGAFHRDIPLPAEVESDNIEAVFRNGVLTIHMPKKPEARQKGKKIEVKSG